MNTVAALVAAVLKRRRAVVALTLAVTLLLGSGAGAVELATSLEEFRGGTDEAAAATFIDHRMSGGEPNATQSLLVIRDDERTVSRATCLRRLPADERSDDALANATAVPVARCQAFLAERGVENATFRSGKEDVLTKAEYLRHLRLQRALRGNETVNRTLVADQPPLGIANVVAIVAIERANGTQIENISVDERPSLDAQIRAVENLSSFQVKLFTSYAVGEVLSDVDHTWPPGGAFAFVPTSYEANSKTAHATAIVVSHRENATPENLTAAQLAAAEIADRYGASTDAFVVGDGTVNDELRRSARDSLRLVGPVAILFVVGVLVLAYRDLLDVLLGLLGVAMVLLWTFGFMGWAGIAFNQLFVAVPVLLMGLAIDYAIHVFMRQREQREPPEGRSAGAGATSEASGKSAPVSMADALKGVGPALALVTLTTAAGFLSNLVSGVAPIREFGVVSAVGIVSAFVIFGAFVPVLKIELDSRLEARGWDRRKRAVGTSGGVLTAFLAGCIAAARTAPWGVIALAALATAGGLVGAATVETGFERDDLLVHEDDVPGWAESLPEPFAPSEYEVAANLDYVERNDFIYDGTLAEILVRGDVTRDDSLERLKRAQNRANATDVVLELPNKQPGTRSTLTAMAAVAEDNERFRTAFERADTDGNGVPDRNLKRVYDAFYAAAPDVARTMLAREDGRYRALRVKVPVNGSAGEGVIATQIRNSTAPVSGDGLRAVATGQPVENQAVAAQLLDTVVESLAATLLVVGALLAIVYRRTEGASLGVVTLLPVLLAVAWILGTMSVLGIPFNVMTALITSFTIGLGVDYSIHVSERYAHELRAVGADEALERAVLGTGGALLGSAATTAGGFGVLAFAILAPLQQFGVITALTIVYSFLASVVVLPALLVVWTDRYASPGGRNPGRTDA